MRKLRLLAAAPAALAALTGLTPPPQEEAAPAETAASPEAPEPDPAAPPEAPEAEPAAPLEARAAEPRLPPAVAIEHFQSSGSDGTEVARAALELGVGDSGDTRSIGLRIERAGYNPSGRGWQSRDRIFLRGAGKLGSWQLRARVGTDGDSLIGSASLNDDSKFRKEFFVERDIVETRQGLDRGLYSTFAGAAVDLPVDDRNVFTALAGVQAFTGDNVRTHLRASYIHVLDPKIGLSAQLRGRWFRNSDPSEFDYYSPRWYAEILPVAQMRRFVRGWELVGAAGVGLQRDSGSDWRSSRYAHARFRSPPRSGWSLNGNMTYTNTPSVSGTPGSGYRYVQATIGVSKRF
ncbi:MAG TPA: hypothetical protein VF650_02580 [Allosphingosinicella sp.]|jgi:hypothetical protein